MNKAIDLLSDWINEKARYLELLEERRDTQEKWTHHPDKTAYYTPRYQQTVGEITLLEAQIRECEKAVTILINHGGL